MPKTNNGLTSQLQWQKELKDITAADTDAEQQRKDRVLDNVATWHSILNSIPQVSYSKYNAYKDLIDKYKDKDYLYDVDVDGFPYDKSINDFMNPNASTIVNEAGNAMKRSNPLRQGYGLDVDYTTSKTNKYNELFNDAKNDWQSDREYNYGLWKDNIANEQMKLDYEKSMDDTSLSLAKSLSDYEQTMNDAYMSTYSEIQKTMMDMLTQNGMTWNDIGGNPFTAQTSNSNIMGV